MKYLEYVGILVLGLVATATSSHLEMLSSMPAIFSRVAVMMMVLLVLLLGISIVRNSIGISYRLLFVFGMVLVGVGAYVVYVTPSYFQYAYELPVTYWLKVCWYTLPAIMIEGGILTLFTVLIERGLNQRTNREKMLLSVMYASMTVTANFLVLGGIISIPDHILWSQVIVTAVLVVSTAVAVRSVHSPRCLKP